MNFLGENRGVKMLVLISLALMIVSVFLLVTSNAFMYTYSIEKSLNIALPAVYSTFIVVMIIANALFVFGKISSKTMTSILFFCTLVFIIIDALFGTIYASDIKDSGMAVALGSIGMFLLIISTIMNILMNGNGKQEIMPFSS